jgi:hypothetical protein
LVLATSARNFAAVPQSYILEPLAFTVTPFLTYLNHSRSRTSSSILLLFWPVYLVTLLVWGRTAFLRTDASHNAIFVVKSVIGALGAVAFVLECFGPEVGDCEEELSVDGKKVKKNPYETANIFSRWSFGWMTPLLSKGATQYIVEDDLPPLLRKNTSDKLGDDLTEARRKQ